MNNLEQIMKERPNCLNSAEILRGCLMDFGWEGAILEVTVHLFDNGIVERVRRGGGRLSRHEAHSLTVNLEKLYGISPQYIEKGIELWAEALGASVEPESIPVPPPADVPESQVTQLKSKLTEEPVKLEVAQDAPEAKSLKPKWKKTRKFIGIAVLVLVFVGILGIYDADTHRAGEGVRWNLHDGTLTISGQGAMDDFNWALNPAPWEDEKDTIETVVVEDGVTYIGSRAFQWYDSLSEVVLSKSVKEIGDNAFADCSQISNVELSEGLEKIGVQAFYSCSNLREVEIPSSVKYIDRWAFDGTHLKSVRLSDECLFSFDAFPFDADILNSRPMFGSCGENVQWVLDDSGLLTISGSGEVLPHSWPYIENDFFVAAPWYPRRSEIKAVTIEKGITSIGEGAFYGCNTLTDVTIADSVTYVERYAFSDCEMLSDISFPDSITDMGVCVFNNCSELENVNLPSGMTRIPPSTFKNCISLKEIQLPAQVTAIEGRAFYGCESLERISIPESVTKIGYGAFQFCESLKSITLPKACMVEEGAIPNGVKISYQN